MLNAYYTSLYCISFILLYYVYYVYYMLHQESPSLTKPKPFFFSAGTLFQGGKLFRQISTKLETNFGCVQLTPAPCQFDHSVNPNQQNSNESLQVRECELAELPL